MDFRILGPLELVVDGRAIPVNAPKHRVLLAMLLLRPNRMVGADELVDQLWDRDPPRSARATLQTYVQRLRRVIGDADRIVTLTGGYRISLELEELDLHRFRAMFDQARHTDDLEERVRLLRGALGQWRGAALADVPSDLIRAIDMPRLEQERLAALESLFDADLRLGRHGELVHELRTAADLAPLRERLHGQLMLALYRSGQQAEAFAAYQRIKEALADELGVDPDAELQALYQQLLARDPAIAAPRAGEVRTAPAAEDPAPRELPADVLDFVGRDDVAGQVRSVLTGSESGVPIVVISGLPGVGKTALAVKVAHDVRERFPDGQLYVNLRGYAPTPALTATEALARFLISLGAAPRQLPSDQDGLVGLFRTLLGGRRVLILLDDAAGPGQVRPLLPNAPGCAVLVTSRGDLRGLVALQGARSVDLGVLTDEQSHALLATMIGAGRVAAELPVVAELAQLCGRLPLALRIAAANLAIRPECSLAEYVAELREGNRLASLEIEGDEEATVRTAFQLSYVTLDPDAARAFRLLGLVTGLDFSVEAVAALAGIPDERARTLLDQLTMANLVMRGNGPRYQLHDLLRLFVVERCTQDEEPGAAAEAALRLLTFYLHHVEAAAKLLYPMYVRLPRPVWLDDTTRVGFADQGEAIAWMDKECVNVLAAVVSASGDRFRALAWLLVEAVRPYLVISGRYREEGFNAFGVALSSAVAEENFQAVATIHNSMGSLSVRHGDIPGAMRHFTEELLASRTGGHIEGQARALIGMGAVHREMSQVDEGAERIREGLELARRTENLPLQRFGWLGTTYVELLRGNLDVAEQAGRQTIALCDFEGEQASEGNARGMLGEILLQRGHCVAAIAEFARSLELLRRGAVGHFQADVLGHLSLAYKEIGDLAMAGQNARLALRVARESGVRDDEAEALTALAAVHRAEGDLNEADRLYRAALAVCREVRYDRGEISALIGHAETSRSAGDLALAVSLAQNAVALSEAAGLRILGLRARIALAHAELDNGGVEAAARHAEASVAAAQQFGAQLDHARALYVLGLVRQAVGDPAAARQCRQQAQESVIATGLPESAGLRRLLADGHDR